MGVDLPHRHRRAGLDPAAVGVAAEHVDVAEDGAGDDLADRAALHDHVGLAAGHEEGGGGHRALVEEAVAGKELPEPGHRPDPGVVGDREVAEEVVRGHPPPARPRFVVSLPVSRSTVMSPPPFPAPTDASNWNALHSLYSTLHTLGASLFLVTTATDARDTRDRILDATVRLLRRQGYTATGIKQIVAEADAPLGSMYHYFPGGKEQIGAEALVRAGERTRRTIAQAADAPDLPAVINNFFVYNAERLRDSDYAQGCPIATVALETASDNERIRKVCEDAFHGLAGHARRGVRRRRHRRGRRRAARHVRAVELRGRAHHEPRACATSSRCSRAAPRWRRCSTRTWATRLAPADTSARARLPSRVRSGAVGGARPVGVDRRRAARRPLPEAHRAALARPGDGVRRRRADQRDHHRPGRRGLRTKPAARPTGLGLLVGAVGYYVLTSWLDRRAEREDPEEPVEDAETAAGPEPQPAGADATAARNLTVGHGARRHPRVDRDRPHAARRGQRVGRARRRGVPVEPARGDRRGRGAARREDPAAHGAAAVRRHRRAWGSIAGRGGLRGARTRPTPTRSPSSSRSPPGR